MINVTRDADEPSSLQSLNIQNYILEVQAHLADPENIAKPLVSESYRNSDLLEAFDRCFHQKCYLTEKKFPNSWCMDVEHFVGQSENPALIYEWKNLYPADHKYNNMKPRRTPVGGYLDPCEPLEDVEKDIRYTVGVGGLEPGFEPKDPANIKAVNTSNLLNRLHKGHDEKTIKSTAEIRHEIYKKYDLINNLLIDWLAAPAGSDIKYQYQQQLRSHLSRHSSFTMLMRSMVGVIN